MRNTHCTNNAAFGRLTELHTKRDLAPIMEGLQLAKVYKAANTYGMMFKNNSQYSCSDMMAWWLGGTSDNYFSWTYHVDVSQCVI